MYLGLLGKTSYVRWKIPSRPKRDWTWMFHRSPWCQDSNSHYNQSARRCWLESSDRVCHGKVSSLFLIASLDSRGPINGFDFAIQDKFRQFIDLVDTLSSWILLIWAIFSFNWKFRMQPLLFFVFWKKKSIYWVNKLSNLNPSLTKEKNPHFFQLPIIFQYNLLQFLFHAYILLCQEYWPKYL